MEKEGISMNEEKKNLSKEERQELKEKMKKQIDEMSDEELDKVAGGFTDRNPYQEQRFVFTEEELIKLYNGICPKCSQKIDKTKILEHVKNCGL